MQIFKFKLKLIKYTYAFGPSCLNIFTAQSNVFLYLAASKPCLKKKVLIKHGMDKNTLKNYNFLKMFLTKSLML